MLEEFRFIGYHTISAAASSPITALSSDTRQARHTRDVDSYRHRALKPDYTGLWRGIARATPPQRSGYIFALATVPPISRYEATAAAA